jgi:uncharacterized protein
MIVSEMDRRECKDLIERLGFGRIACCLNGQPYIVPAYFVVDSDNLYSFSTMGQKIEWMRSNPSVCVEFDQVNGHTEWSSVVVFGRYEELPDESPHTAERLRAQGQLQKNRELWWQTGFEAAQTRSRFDRQRPIFYAIRIEKMTGHRAATDPVEASIAWAVHRST